MRFISGDDVDHLLSVPPLVQALEDAFASDIRVPERHHHAIAREQDHATHLIMPAWTAGAPGAGQYLGTKIVNVFPGNRALGLPAVLGLYLLQSGETGAPLAVIDGTRLTYWRTAAASALAARFLARSDAERLVMVGAGALAPFLVRAHASVRPIRQVSVWNHRNAGARDLAAKLTAEGFEAQAVEDLGAAVAEADVVSCATLSTVALVRGAWLRPGTHLDLVGAFTMAMREADDEAVSRARVFLDTPAAAHEGGDVAQAIRGGVIEAGHVLGDLHGLCRGTVAGRTRPDDLTLFKSVGTAIEDLAAARLIWSRLGEPNG